MTNEKDLDSLIKEFEEKTGCSYEQAKEFFDKVHKIISEAWEIIRSSVSDVLKLRQTEEYENRKFKLRTKSKTIKPETPFVTNYNIRFARSNL